MVKLNSCCCFIILFLVSLKYTMNEKNFELARNLIPTTYVYQGRDAIRRREKQVTELLSNRKIPEIGWDNQTIE